MAARALEWSGPEGGQIGVGFDDEHFGLDEMRAEIASAGRAYPNLPDQVPPGSRFAFGRDTTGHLQARFRVGRTIYRSGDRTDLRALWDTVGLIDRLPPPERRGLVSRSRARTRDPYGIRPEEGGS